MDQKKLSKTAGGVTRLRSSEKIEFHHWLDRFNNKRVLMVGIVLLVFSGIAIITAPAQNLTPYIPFYGTFALGLFLGIGGIYVGNKFSNHGLAKFGGYLVMATAVVWTFFAALVGTSPENTGLPQYIIGTLALCMLYVMRPMISSLVLVGFVIVYGIGMELAGIFDLGRLINGAVFTTFGGIVAVGNYSSKVYEFRNVQLVQLLNQKNFQLSSLSMEDPLTGLPNRRFFDQILQEKWSNPNLAGSPTVLLLGDIDFFKQYNDTYGHPKGDELLKAIGKLLAHQIRSDGVAIRLGGEEFAIVLDGITLETGLKVAQRMRLAVESQGQVTMSFGVSQITPSQGSIEDLYSTTDKALYQAKAQGRNLVVLSNEKDSMPKL
jgi:diguanylate cyclase (GGDEF)-like protein